MLPFESTSMRLFDMAPKTGAWVPVLRMPRSIVSVVALCTSPNFADPPFFGSAPMPTWLSIVVEASCSRPVQPRGQ
jgi:hypothetical protein